MLSYRKVSFGVETPSLEGLLVVTHSSDSATMARGAVPEVSPRTVIAASTAGPAAESLTCDWGMVPAQ